MMATTLPGTSPWSARYEWQAVLLLSLGFGLVAFDRSLIVPMFPTIMSDLKLSYQDLGNITGALAFSWGIAAFLAGRLSDRIGRRVVLVVSMVCFSVLVGISGLAAGATSLIIVRALMGAAEGAYVPPSIAATLEAARPDRHGLFVGLQQSAGPLLGMALAPILATQLLAVVDWRWIFVLVAVPGLLLAVLIARVIRAPAPMAREAASETYRLGELVRHRNVPLAAVAMLCWLTCLIGLGAFLPSYLTDHLHLSNLRMGYMLSAVGVGSALGCVIVPALSDRMGRKPAAILSVVAAALGIYALSKTGTSPWLLYPALAWPFLFIHGLIALTVGPLAMEGLPNRMHATSSGAIIAVGEIVGGGLAPILVGFVAHHYGLPRMFALAECALVIGLVACAALESVAIAGRAEGDEQPEPAL